MFLANELRHLVNEFGHTVTYRKKSLGTYDPATGSLSGGTNTEYTSKAYFYNYRLEEMADSKIVQGDRRIVFPRYDTSGNEFPEPSVGDQVVGQGNTVSIVSFQRILDAGEVVCYTCQVRA